VIILIVLFGLGVWHWVFFLNSGKVSFRLHDWGQEHIYYQVIRQGLETGRVPYHMSMEFHQTDRFMSIPDTNLSPQVLLLPLMDTGTFILVDLLVFYSLGFLGLVLLWRKYRISLIPLAGFFLVFNFNGHITSHLAVGHTAWSGYFLLPLLFLLLLKILEGEGTRRTPLLIALVMFGMVLKGSFHLFTWCVMLLVLVLIFSWRQARALAVALGFAGLLSAFRFLPALGLLGKKEKFIWSYPTLRDLADAMITIRQVTPERLKPWGNAGWWEYDLYLGLTALVALVLAGVYLRFRRDPDLEGLRFPALDIPMLLMTVFSLSYVHAFVTRIPLPLLRGERVATRFAVVPVCLLSLLACLRLSAVIRRWGHGVKVVTTGIGLLVVMGLGFLDHSFLWSVARLERITKLKVFPPATAIVAGADQGYRLSVLAGWAITLVVLGITLFFLIKPRRLKGLLPRLRD
jgi:hypothetical protein